MNEWQLKLCERNREFRYEEWGVMKFCKPKDPEKEGEREREREREKTTIDNIQLTPRFEFGIKLLYPLFRLDNFRGEYIIHILRG